MDLGIAEKTTVVLGGGGGLGGAIARALAAEGARVVVAGRTEENVSAVAQSIRGAGGTAIPRVIDLGRPDTFAAHLEAVRQELGQIQILVNMTGGPPPTTAAGVEPELWNEQFRLMVLSVIHLTDLVLPDMRSTGFGRIITSTSSGTIAPIPNLGISNALRGALVGWSKTLSREVGGDGVTVNLVVPGRIATRRIQELDRARAERQGTDLAAVVKQSTSTIPIGRYGDPDEYAAAVAFLASRQAAYITGATLRVDGGLIPSI